MNHFPARQDDGPGFAAPGGGGGVAGHIDRNRITAAIDVNRRTVPAENRHTRA